MGFDSETSTNIICSMKMNSLKHIDLSAYKKKSKEKTLIEKLSVPVTPEMKAKIDELKKIKNVNEAVRDFLDCLVQSSRSA